MNDLLQDAPPVENPLLPPVPVKKEIRTVDQELVDSLNTDGSLPGGTLQSMTGEYGQRMGIVPAESAGAGEIGRGFRRGLLQWVSSKANTFGLEDLKRSADYEMATNQQLFPANSKGTLANILNRASGTIGAVGPDIAAGIVSSAVTGGLGAAPALASGVGKAFTFVSMAAGMWGDNEDRLKETMPEVDPATRMGLNLILTPLSSALFTYMGPEGKTVAEASTIMALKGLKAGDAGALRALGMNSMGALGRFVTEYGKSVGTGVGATVASQAANDILTGIVDPKMTEDQFVQKIQSYPKLILDSSIDMIGMALLPSTLNAIKEYSARRYGTDIALMSKKNEEVVNPTIPAPEGSPRMVIDADARDKTEAVFMDMEKNLPVTLKGVKQKDAIYSPMIQLVRTLAYHFAAEQKRSGLDPTARPEKFVKDLSTLVVNDKVHGPALIALADDEPAQIAYINKNIGALAKNLYSVRQSANVREHEASLVGLRKMLKDSATILDESRKASLSSDLGKALSGQVKTEEGATVVIPARLLVKAIGPANTELAKSAYVDGEFRSIEIDGKKYDLKIDKDWTGLLMPEGTLASDKTLLEQASKAVADETGFNATRDSAKLASLRAETLRLQDQLTRAQNFENLWNGKVMQSKAVEASIRAREAARLAKLEEANAAIRKQNKSALDVNLAMRKEAEGTGNEAHLASRTPEEIVENQKNLNDQATAWDLQNRRSRTDAWFEGGKLNESATRGFDEALAQGGDKLQAHGMAKETTLGSGIKTLLNIIGKGLDPSRRGGQLDTAQLVSSDAMASGGTTAGGTAYRDGPFILVAKKGQSLNGNLMGLGAVLVNEAHTNIVGPLRSEIQSIRPDIIVETYSNAGEVAKRLSATQTTENISTATIRSPSQEKGGQMVGQYNRARQLMLFYANHDPSTLVHEWFHHLYENKLANNTVLDALRSAYTVKVQGKDDWTLASKENAANAFAQYVLEGKLPANADALYAFNYLKNVLSTHWKEMKTFMQNGKETFAGDEKLVVPEKVKAKFDEALGNITPDLEAKLFGSALGTSLGISGATDPVYISDKDILNTAAPVAQSQGKTIEQVVLDQISRNPKEFGEGKKLSDLTPDQKLALQRIIGEERDLYTTVEKPPKPEGDGWMFVPEGTALEPGAEIHADVSGKFEKGAWVKYADEAIRAKMEQVLNQKSTEPLASHTLDRETISMMDRDKIQKKLYGFVGRETGLTGDDLRQAVRDKAIEMFGPEMATIDAKGETHVLTNLSDKQLLQLMDFVRPDEPGKAEIPGLQTKVDAVAGDIAANGGLRTQLPEHGPLAKRVLSNAKQVLVSKVRWVNSKLPSAYQLSEVLVGHNEEAPLIKQVMRPIYKAVNTGHQELKIFKAKVYRFLLENEIPMHEIEKQIGLAGNTFRNSDAIGIYTATDFGKDLARTDIVNMKKSWSFNLTDAHIKAAIALVEKTPWMKKLAHFQSDTQNELTRLAAPAFLRNTGKELKLREGAYMTRMYQDGSVHEADPLSVLNMNGGMDATRYGLKSPTGASSGEAGVRQQMDAFNAFLHHSAVMIEYRHQADSIREGLEVLADQKVTDAFEKTFGDTDYLHALKSMIARELSPSGKLRPEGEFDSFFRGFNANAAATYLPYSAGAIGAQPISILTGMAMLPWKESAYFAWRAATNIGRIFGTIPAILKGEHPLEAFRNIPDIQFVLEHSPAVMEGLKTGPELALMEAAATGGLNSIRFGKMSFAKYKDVGMYPMNLLDAAVRSAMYRTAFDAKMSDLAKVNKFGPEAVARAEYEAARSVRLSSNPSTKGERGLYQSEGNELVKGMMLFMSSQMAQLNMLLYDNMLPFATAVVKDWKGKTIKETAKILPSTMKKLAFGAFLPGIALGMLSRRRMQKDMDEVIKDAFLGGIVATLPIIGNAYWAWAVFGLGDGGNVKITGIWEDTLNKVSNALNHAVSGEFTFNDFRQVGDVIHLLKGAPRAPWKFMTSIYSDLEIDGKKMDMDTLCRAIGLLRKEE